MTKAVRTPLHDCDIRVDRCSNGVVVTVAGDLDWSSTAELLEEVGPVASEPRLVVDLSLVTYLDSAGTGALITAILNERRAGKQMAIVATGEVADVLGAVGIAQVVSVVPTRTAAEASLNFRAGA